ncbi:hypothetical protein M2480_002786 [Parabacteroides sp. PFB2-12]|uniref:RagB/SusD family nutrient uptake outer membrane protein n=1 Tax=unclassified Parabacteroides TaxID=2649774 RepID=UPI0024733AB3|nr:MULTISPECIES: RagB/SusD family nutrient uptake outer membrane protein [unclassified Parabacteroides]MDH6342655.1 hypothetical protein [Parabacteroides sp. PM6-13]MDH6391784.1 hypothetical protein [Parabacteroides sp. PFB2-12]
MKYINKLFILATAAVSLCACSDFLDKEPLSQGTEAIFYKTPEHFIQAANSLYDIEGWKDYDGKATYYKMDQGTDISGFGSNGGGSVGEGDFRWNKPYEYIRKCNIVLTKAAAYEGAQEDIASSVGTALFFRAWQHFYLLQYFGGVPIVEEIIDVATPVLYGPRNSRYEVIDFIIKDLREAIKKLPQEKNIVASDRGKVSQEAAKSFLARVLLYEATWEKYVPTIGYDLDGNGSSTGAGTTKPAGYPSITDMLTEAKKMSKEVIDEAETGTYQLWQECDSLSYFYLFNLDDKGGNIANPWGKGKATNKEFIFTKKYDFDLLKGGINMSHTVYTWQASNISTVFGESFLCRNGLPIRVSYTGNMADAQDNPQFGGYKDFMDEYQNRDYRFTSCTFLPDRPVWTSRAEDGRQLTELGKAYPDPVYPAPSDVYNANDPAYSSKLAVFTPLIGLNSTHNGYGSRKFGVEGAKRNSEQESADYPLIRLAEVHLIYAEATCELGNGAISDADLDFSINKNRARAGVAPLTNALIANVWDAGYWDHEQNKTICKKMNMMDEIRRERACELFAEGFRENDLKRWGIAHINLKGQKLGRKIYGTAYMTAKANDATYFGQTAYDPSVRPTQYGIYEGTGPNDPDYGRPIATLPANTLYSQRDYLRPIPLGQIRLNENLAQNPGW